MSYFLIRTAGKCQRSYSSSGLYAGFTYGIATGLNDKSYNRIILKIIEKQWTRFCPCTKRIVFYEGGWTSVIYAIIN